VKSLYAARENIQAAHKNKSASCACDWKKMRIFGGNFRPLFSRNMKGMLQNKGIFTRKRRKIEQ
jgi:hypothetical protein